MVGLIIGRGGEQITRLQAETGCKIQMASDSGSPGLVFSKTFKKNGRAFQICLVHVQEMNFLFRKKKTSFYFYLLLLRISKFIILFILLTGSAS